MLSRERKSLIEKRILAEGKVVAADLAVEYGVSEDTIRRDLRDMASAGRCERVYGGALAPDGITPLARRVSDDAGEKALLGRHVAAHVQPGMTVFLDAGSTNMHVLQALPRGSGVTVVTHAPSIAALLSDDSDMRVILIGGAMTAGVGACVDAKAIQDVAMFNPDLFVMGICGLAQDGTVSAEHHGDALFKRAVADLSSRIIVPVTRSKLGRRERYTVMSLDARSLLISTAAEKAELAHHVMCGCAVEIARGSP